VPQKSCWGAPFGTFPHRLIVAFFWKTWLSSDHIKCGCRVVCSFFNRTMQKPVFCWNPYGICLVTVWKLAETILTSLPFQALWSNRHIFWSFKKNQSTAKTIQAKTKCKTLRGCPWYIGANPEREQLWRLRHLKHKKVTLISFGHLIK